MSVAELIVNLPTLGLQRGGIQLSGALRVNSGAFPDFIIIGAQKSGTTSLHGYLSRHPQVLPSATKEVHYFDRYYRRGPDWYRRQFLDPSALANPPFPARMISGEATPYYLFHPLIAERIAETVPEARLIVLLRDPVARAYSHYQHNLRRRQEDLPFAEALKRESDVVPVEEERLAAGVIEQSSAHQDFSYLSRGRYAEQVERYFARFPKEQILILTSEDFFRDPHGIVGQVLRFLDIEPFRLDSWEVPNAGDYDRQAIPEGPLLREYFEPHNARLYHLIGRDLGW